MSIPQVKNFDSSKIPEEGTPEFRENASYVWTTIPSVIYSMNNSINSLNSAIHTISINTINSSSYMNRAETAALKASASALRAESAAPWDNEVSYNKVASDLITKENLLATHPFNGYIHEKQNMRFETSTSNILSVANMNDSYIVDGKVVGTLGEELVVNGTFETVADGEVGYDNGDGTVDGYASDSNISIENNQLKILNNDSYQFTKFELTGLAKGTYHLELNVNDIDSGLYSVYNYTKAEYFANQQSVFGLCKYIFRLGDNETSIMVGLRGHNTTNTAVSFDNISVREISTIDLNTTNNRDGFNGMGDNSFIPNVKVVGFDPISTGSISGNRVAVDAQIGVLDNISAQTANTRIKCRVNPTTNGIKIEVLNKSDSDAVVRTQTVDGTDAETLTFTLPVNDDGYKVKATKITNDGVDDDIDEDIQVTSEVSTGLVVDGRVKRGDYVVVDKEELVTNGTFDNGISGWSGTGDLSYDSAKKAIYVDRDGDSWGNINKTLVTLKAGVTYVVKVNVLSLSHQVSAYINADLSVDITTTTGEYTVLFTPITDSNSISINPSGNPEANCTINNISIQLADDIYKATEDTDNGYSLASSKFKAQSYISNQIFVGLKQDGTYTQEILMTDAFAKESTTETLTNNGFSSLGRGLFSKGGDVITPIGRFQTLNKGAYHPMLSKYGCATWRNTEEYAWAFTWYSDNANNDMPKESVSDCFNDSATNNIRYDGAVRDSTKSGHPQGKFFDIIYESQWLDMRYSSTKTNLHDTASKVFNDGVSGKGGVCDTLGLTRLPTEPYKQQHEYIEDGTLIYLPITQTKEQFVTDLIGRPNDYNNSDADATQGDDGTVDADAKVWNDTEKLMYKALNDGVNVDDAVSGNADYEEIHTGYPQILKDKLASGSTVVGINPLLVSSSGEDLTVGDKVIKYSRKVITVHESPYNIDNGVWTGGIPFIDSINNLRNSGHAFPVGTHTGIENYTASIPVATIQDPKQVDYVLEKYIASNSHDVELGNNIIGLIGVGTGTDNPKINVIGDTVLNKDGVIVTSPTHNTIALDNTGDKASKAFLTIASDSVGELYAQWILEELSTGWDGVSQFEDDVTDDLDVDTVYQEQDSKLLYRALATKITISDEDTWETPINGDDNEFEQLTNGIITDLNGNTARTVVASTPLNLLKQG